MQIDYDGEAPSVFSVGGSGAWRRADNFLAAGKVGRAINNFINAWQRSESRRLTGNVVALTRSSCPSSLCGHCKENLVVIPSGPCLTCLPHRISRITRISAWPVRFTWEKKARVHLGTHRHPACRLSTHAVQGVSSSATDPPLSSSIPQAPSHYPAVSRVTCRPHPLV